MAFADGTDFVGAVGVERGERQLRRFPGGQVDGDLALPVADDQLAAGAGDRQGDRQRRDHAVHLLRVAMRCEETAGFVDEQLVQPRVEPLGRAAEPGRRLVENPLERIPPRLSGHANPGRVDLPAVAYRGIDQRVRALAVRRAFRRGNQGADLRLGNRKGEQADVVHLQPWHGREQPAVRAEITGTVDGEQQLFERTVVGAVFDVEDGQRRSLLWRVRRRVRRRSNGARDRGRSGVSGRRGRTPKYNE